MGDDGWVEGVVVVSDSRDLVGVLFFFFWWVLLALSSHEIALPVRGPFFSNVGLALEMGIHYGDVIDSGTSERWLDQ